MLDIANFTGLCLDFYWISFCYSKILQFNYNALCTIKYKFIIKGVAYISLSILPAHIDCKILYYHWIVS